MSELKHKTQHVIDAMATAAKEVGLIFVDGPNPIPVSPPEPNMGAAGHQERCVFLTALAEDQ